jgi:cytochrome P450
MSTTATTEPVRWDDETGAYRVTGFAEASAVLRGEGWSSDPRLNPLVSQEIQEMPRGSLLFADPPDHTRLRRLLSPAFTPNAIGRLRPRITAIVDAVLDGLHDTGPEIDILQDVGYPVTLAVIAELLDVGGEGAQLFAGQTPNLVRMIEIDAGPEDLMAGAIASTELMLFLTPILAERSHNPGDDFISALLALQDDSDGLGLDEVLATCILLLAAGHETTANLITNSTLALLTQPEQLPHLFANPERAVEELLRLHGAAKLAGRTALTDHDLGGQHVTTGQPVLVDIQQANRDPRRFPAPQRTDLSRRPTGHLAFGAGPHFCLGAALARLETVETLTRLFTCYPDLALADAPIHWRDSTTFHGLRELPVRIT